MGCVRPGCPAPDLGWVWLQDVCVVLELRDATLLVPNLRKMSAVLGAIPRLEAFVAQVSGTLWTDRSARVWQMLLTCRQPAAAAAAMTHLCQELELNECRCSLAERVMTRLKQCKGMCMWQTLPLFSAA